ncbi:MAG: endolytic transglycosylase MltG [Treponema sp.]|nr:endolytic transglycosylase MltG [Treponema sp.]
MAVHRIFKTMSLIIAVLAGFALLGVALVIGGYWFFNQPPSQTPGTVSFEVYKGETAMTVGKRLEKEGVIKSRYFWYILARLDPNYIKAGTYQLELPATQRDIRSAFLVGPKDALQRVTIPEGVTLKKTASLLEEAAICDDQAFLAVAADPEILKTYQIPGETMEGFLYPDTYLFPQNYPPALVVKTMADTFFQRLEELQIKPQSLSPEELYQKVTLASIVEREYRVDEEARLMAGVFYNRLNISMPLQSCATVEYVITEILGRPHPEVIYTKDTEIRNPYNTYVIPGLPPGPISAPGSVALYAVFNPVISDYLYFRLADGATGRHYFSRTFDDHIKAGLLYVKGNQKSQRSL